MVVAVGTPVARRPAAQIRACGINGNDPAAIVKSGLEHGIESHATDRSLREVGRHAFEEGLVIDELEANLGRTLTRDEMFGIIQSLLIDYGLEGEFVVYKNGWRS